MAEISRVPAFWDPATGYSDDVVVKNANTSASVTVKRGSLLLSDGAGKYTLVTTLALATEGAYNRRLAIALEDVTIAKSGTATIKAVKSGVAFIEAIYEAGEYDSTSAPDYVLDEFGGISNIAFVHVKEVK